MANSSEQTPKGSANLDRELAKKFGVEIIEDLSSYLLSKEFYKRVPYSFVKKHSIIPIQEKGDVLVVATSNPASLEPLEELRLMLGRSIEAVYSSKEEIALRINFCYEKETGEASEMLAILGKEGKEGEEDEVYDLLDESFEQAPIIKLLNLILTEAIQMRSSDLHFEPGEEGLRVRYRIDGVLHIRHTPPLEYQNPLITRIKVMAKMDIAERRLPQDGRIKLRMGKREIDFRVSTIPVVNGERIVLRILDKGNVVLGLDKMGMPGKLLKEFEKLTSLPEGIVLVTGPTGSGKTTTLYSAICGMPEKDMNIMTIEDPVEYKLKGIAQIGVHHKIGLNFAAGLRHILRQDPDVVMIGEIRDLETAEIAIQASLTGHLVLSTLHTNDAPSAIARLVDMGIEPYLLASSLVGVLAQRLVRRICTDCQKAYTPTEEELRHFGVTKEQLAQEHVYRGEGCSSCYETGYKGRHGIYELLKVTPKIQMQMTKSPDSTILRNLGKKEGMMSLRDHGVELVKQGITTIAEVLRVIRGVDDAGL